jgi:phosphoglucosamine mutase
VERFPQNLVNVRADRSRLPHARALWAALAEEDATLSRTGSGRIVLRPSGTEPLVRVMVEHENPVELERVCGRLVELVQEELGLS